MPELPVEERKLNFKEVELGFTEEMALKEAARCLSCRRCIGCGLCLAECDPKAIVYDEQAQTLSFEADSLIYTSDGNLYNPDRDSHLGYARFSNVIASYEFERLISPTGPFGGYLVRPSDGDIPRSIAFIQCVGSRNEGIGADFCSTTCCRQTLLQARRAHQLIDDIKVTVFHRGLRPIGKDSEILLGELEGSDWIDFIEAEVSEITEDDAGNLTVKFGPDQSQGEFDLVVLAVGLRAQADFRRIARAAGRDLNRFGFAEVTLKHLLEGAKPIQLAGSVCGPVPLESAIVQAKAAVVWQKMAARAEPEARSLEGDRVVVFGCGYGLKLAGLGESVLDKISGDSFKLAGIYPYLCHKEGREALAAGIADASRVVIVGCHCGSHEPLFESILGVRPGSITIVEGSQLDGDPAQAITRAVESNGTARSRQLPQVVCIVGSGVAGLAAAWALVHHGVKVHIVEQESEIGSSFRRIALAEGVEAETIDQFIKTVVEDRNVVIHTGCKIKAFTERDSDYAVVLDSDGGEEIGCGAVLIGVQLDRHVPGEYGYGENASILTQDELGQRIEAGKIEGRRIVMVQCVGARDETNRYCSRFCCRQALQNALRCKTALADAEIKVLHRGLRLFGFDEALVGEAIEQGVELVEIDGKVEISGDGPVKIVASTGNGRIDLEADLVVLSVADTPAKSNSMVTGLGVEIDDLGFVKSSSDPLNPFVTSIEGVLVCGPARQPMVAEEAFIDGLAAACTIVKKLVVGC